MLIKNLNFLLLSVSLTLSTSECDSKIQYSIEYNNEIFTATANNLTQTVQNIRKYAKSQAIASKPAQHRRKISKRNSIDLVDSKFNEYEIVGPSCIPLVSKNIDANPYHETLLSLPNKVVRRGIGLPTVITSINPIECKSDTNGCSLTISKSVGTTVTESISMSLSNGESVAITLGSAKTSGLSNSFAKTIGESLENSLSKAITLTDDNSISTSIRNALQQTHDKSSGIIRTKIKNEAATKTIIQDQTNSDTITTDVTSSKSNTTEIPKKQKTDSNTEVKNKRKADTSGVTATFGISGFGVSATTNQEDSELNEQPVSNSNGEDRNWPNTFSNTKSVTDTESESNSNAKSLSLSIGRTTGRTSGFSSSAGNENRVSDTIAVTRDAARNLVKSHSNSDTSTDASRKAYRIDDQFTSSDQSSIALNVANVTTKTKTLSNNAERSFTHTITNSKEHNLPIPPGTCQIAVCKSFVKSVVIPYECIREVNDGYGNINIAYDLVPVTYSLVDLNIKNVSCIYSTIDCYQRYELSQIFHDDNNEFLTATEENSLEYGMEMYPGKLIKSKNEGRFTLELLSNGNLQLKQHNIVIWQNEMGLFEGYKNIRVRINEKGHLIEEVIGLFNETVPEYRANEWVTVWSSAPINHNVTIGIPTVQGMFKSYKLVLEESGHLNLYDSMGVLIWTPSVPDALHKRGYKFPEVYLVPTNFKTPRVVGDKHNSLLVGIKMRDDLTKNGLRSLDVNCMHLGTSEGLRSANGRFKMILEPSGNMILKDGYRTMWETSSAHLPHAIPTYRLFLSPSGEIMIIDAAYHIIWSALLIENVSSAGPFKLMLEDTGRLNVTDKNGKTVWDSWPINGMSYGTVTFERIKYRFVKCHGKLKNGYAAESYRNGDKYLGDWKDDKRHGVGRYEFKNGDVYEGHWKADLQNGLGSFVWKNGTVYKGFWLDGKRHGNGTLIEKKGIFSGEFKYDLLNGRGKYEGKDGSFYEGDWKNHMKDGYGVFKYIDGSRYEGHFKGDMRHGKGTIYYNNNEIYEGDWFENKKHGKGFYYLLDGSKHRVTFKNDILTFYDTKSFKKYKF